MSEKCPLCNGKLNLNARDYTVECENTDCMLPEVEPYVIDLLRSQISLIRQQAKKEGAKEIFNFLDTNEYFHHGDGEYEEDFEKPYLKLKQKHLGQDNPGDEKEVSQ